MIVLQLSYLFFPLNIVWKRGIYTYIFINGVFKIFYMNYQVETLRAYDLYPTDFDRKFASNFECIVRPEANEFMHLLPGKKILDIGSGSGNHALHFQKHGFEVLCMDRSLEMLKLCSAKNLRNVCMDIENIDRITEKFDGLWMYASLLHLPKGIVTN